MVEKLQKQLLADVLQNVVKLYPLKKCFFWSNSYKIEVMITSLIETLEYTNFDHMTTSTI